MNYPCGRYIRNDQNSLDALDRRRTWVRWMSNIDEQKNKERIINPVHTDRKPLQIQSGR